jgi:hypothetical protein
VTASWGGGTARWRLSASSGGGGVSLRMLAARFPSFTFGTRRMHNHVSFEAVRCDKDTPGVVVVITKDMGELRQVLLEDENLAGQDTG